MEKAVGQVKVLKIFLALVIASKICVLVSQVQYLQKEIQAYTVYNSCIARQIPSRNAKPTGHEHVSWAVYTQCIEHCVFHQIYSMAAKELHHHGSDKLSASENNLLHMAMQNEFVQPTRNLK